MCRSGNQTVKQECRHVIIKELKKVNPSNQEMRRVLNRNDGCMITNKQELLVAKEKR